ncbi:MAG: AMP-binding enzyme, partial [Rhodoferax sp.]
PATMAAVIAHPEWPRADLSSLRLLNSGSMVVPETLIQAFHSRGIPVGQIYGATETAPIATALRAEDAMRKAGSAGKAVPHCDVTLVEGEIWARGPALMRGYWNAGKVSGLTDEGWFRSGDLGRLDEEGFLWVVGRSKDVIISGGENIYPAEIENLLASHPLVAECAVLGQPDAQWGEIVVAVVVLRQPASADGNDALADWEPTLREFLRSRIARYKQPRRWRALPALPKTALGKVQKQQLASQLL